MDAITKFLQSRSDARNTYTSEDNLHMTRDGFMIPPPPPAPESNPILGGNEIQGFPQPTADDVMQERVPSNDIGGRLSELAANALQVFGDDFGAAYQQYKLKQVSDRIEDGSLQPVDYQMAVIENPTVPLGDYYDAASGTFSGVPSDDYILHQGQLYPRVITDAKTGEEIDLSEDNLLVNFGRALMGGMMDPLEGATVTARAVQQFLRGGAPDPTVMNMGLGGDSRTVDDVLENEYFDRFGNTGVRGTTSALDDEPLSFNLKPIEMWTPDDFAKVGDAVGVERLGPASQPTPMQLMDGREVNIPGGLEGKFTYYDLLTIKSQGIDASQIPESVHAQLQKKMSRSLMLDKLTDNQVWSGLAFGMTSPNNPLFPNQVAMSRLRGEEAIDELAGSINWKFGDEVDPAVREKADREIAAKFSLNAGLEGGLGVRGTQNYTRVAELAKLFKENPKYFRRRKNEEWPEFAERVFSQVAGLRAKTGSFSIVFQDPLEAGVSAIDRHMGHVFRDKILADPKQRLQWQERALNLYNTRNKLKGKKKVTTMNQLPNGFIGEMILSEVGKTSSPKLRLADGEKNPNVPKRLRDEDFIIEPGQVELMGTQYKAALQANQEEALKHGLGVFSSQWMLWDRMRRRLEPHENMFPGLERVPRPSIEQVKRADDVHREAGFKDYTKEIIDEAEGEFRMRPTRPVSNPSKLAYFSIPIGLMMLQSEAMLSGLEE